MKDSCFKGMAGAYAAMFTQISKDGRINEGAIEEIVDYGIGSGLTGFYLTSSTGGWFLLSPEERELGWKRAYAADRDLARLWHLAPLDNSNTQTLKNSNTFPSVKLTRLAIVFHGRECVLCDEV